MEAKINTIHDIQDLYEFINGLIRDGYPLSFEQEQDIACYIFSLKAKNTTNDGSSNSRYPVISTLNTNTGAESCQELNPKPHPT